MGHDGSVDAFFSGAYEKIEGVSDGDDEDGENLIEKDRRKKRSATTRRRRMADSPRKGVSEYNTGDDDPDFVEIDSDEEMERLIMNPRDERAREKAERQIVDLTGILRDRRIYKLGVEITDTR